jgi:CBS domain-containing protein
LAVLRTARVEVPMQVREIMTQNPACCSPSTKLPEVARLMKQHDCGEIPVVDGRGQVVGVITDRDITCRVVAAGRNPAEVSAAECMSTPVVTVHPDADLEECLETMEEHQIRRVPVLDGGGVCCGIIAQADIARRAPAVKTAEVVREVSRPH